MADLAGFAHGQELETVERVRGFVEIGLHHLLRLALDLASLLENRGLLALERARHLRSTLLRLLRLLTHPLERPHELLVALILRELRDLLAGLLSRHRETNHLTELGFQVRQLCHCSSPLFCS